MTANPDLFSSIRERELCRASDWWTSHAAARQIQPMLPALHAEVLAAVREAGERGIIASDLPDGRWKRLSELERRGLIKRTGHARPGPTGRAQAVWVVAEEG